MLGGHHMRHQHPPRPIDVKVVVIDSSSIGSSVMSLGNVRVNSSSRLLALCLVHVLAHHPLQCGFRLLDYSFVCFFYSVKSDELIWCFPLCMCSDWNLCKI